MHRLFFEVYDETSSPKKKTCRAWFEYFWSDFDLRDKEHLRQPKKFEDVELQELFNEDQHKRF